MKNSRTGAKYSPRHRSGTKRNFNSGRISAILMAVARRGGISAKLDLTETVMCLYILRNQVSLTAICRVSLHFPRFQSGTCV
ncbi:hypothetical protein ALC57_09230 [Trachymyrmex cornetzi]|uniref:Uncharacterized protein n=1 Tax=Trachymyrmex cornetzi TaxID=471704 RepID=A0A195E081_9HYME|nr:hypothetical protein ALC57_09230 [Trachymyrmex cornetzi]